MTADTTSATAAGEVAEAMESAHSIAASDAHVAVTTSKPRRTASVEPVGGRAPTESHAAAQRSAAGPQRGASRRPFESTSSVAAGYR